MQRDEYVLVGLAGFVDHVFKSRFCGFAPLGWRDHHGLLRAYVDPDHVDPQINDILAEMSAVLGQYIQRTVDQFGLIEQHEKEVLCSNDVSLGSLDQGGAQVDNDEIIFLVPP